RTGEENIPAEEIAVKGAMSDARRERLRQALIRHWHGKPKGNTAKFLTPERLEELLALDHVESVTPDIGFHGSVHFNGKKCGGSAASKETNDARLRRRLVAGAVF